MRRLVAIVLFLACWFMSVAGALVVRVGLIGIVAELAAGARDDRVGIALRIEGRCALIEQRSIAPEEGHVTGASAAS